MEILGMFGPTEILLILFALSFIVLQIVALIDILRNEFTSSNKLIWILVVLLLPVVGSILYFVIGMHQKIDVK